MLSPSAQTNISAISNTTVSRSGVRAPYVRKVRKLPLRDVILQFLETNNIRSAEDRITYETNVRNISIIEQIKLQFPDQWNAMEGTESKIRAKVGNIMTEQFRKNKVVVEQLIDMVVEHADNNAVPVEEVPVEEVLIEEVLIEEVPVEVPVEELPQPQVNIPVVLEDNTPIPDIVSMSRRLEEISDGMITRLEYAAENASSRTLSNIDVKTQELHEQMVASYRELTVELKDTLHSYKKKISKMMDAKIQQVDGVVLDYRIARTPKQGGTTFSFAKGVRGLSGEDLSSKDNESPEPEPAITISMSGVISTVAVFATLGFFMFM